MTNQYIALEKSCKELSNSIALQGSTSAVHTRKKAWTQCTPKYQKKRVQQVAKKVQTTLLFTNEGQAKLIVRFPFQDVKKLMQVGSNYSLFIFFILK